MARTTRLRAGLSIGLVLLSATHGSAQTCTNAGVFNTTQNSCVCPSGFGGATCSNLVCTNPIANQTSRTAFDINVAGASNRLGCSNQCTNGWSGPTCTIAQNQSTCLNTITSIRGVSDSTLYNSGDLYADVVHNTGAYVWTEGFTLCNVVNPTVQAVFSGDITLSFQNSFDTTQSLYPASSVPDKGFFASLGYAATSGNTSYIEQFFCGGDQCKQTNGTENGATSVTWECQNLNCTCIPGTQFCGGGGLDLTTTINGLTGSISVECMANGPTCYFRQETLNSIFGSTGLELDTCYHSECVQSSVISTLASQRSGEAAGGGGTDLPPGVIAGLVILGVFVLVLLVLVFFGCLTQKKARRGRGAWAKNLHDSHNFGPVGMRWTSLGYALPSGRVGVLGRQRRQGRVILDNLTGEVPAGKLCAILGPTGAGKSTFVEILAGKRKTGEVSGHCQLVLPPDTAPRQVKVGVVDQHDVLPATATVRECLHFAADLKMPETTSLIEKKERVFEILSLLGLLECADTLVGDTEHRGISGGERRRLSIGLELLETPAVLICDEPTSGLDSSAARKVVQVLKQLSEGLDGSTPTTVITTIHQPSSAMLDVFDQLILFGSDGRMLYNGSAREGGAYFAERGRPVPPNYNPCDWFLEIAVAHDYKGDADTLNGSTEKVPLTYPPRLINSPTASMQSKPRACMLTQFETLAQRELRNLKRDYSLVVMHVGVACALGLFVGGMYYQVDDSIGGFQSRIGALFFLGTLIAFSSLSALSNFSKCKSLFLRERANGYYSPFAWLASRVAFDLVPLRMIPILIVSTIVYWMVGLSPNAAQFFKFWLILVLYSFVCAILNFLIGAVITDTGNAILISSILNLSQMSFAGFFIHLSSIPGVLRWIQWLCPLKYVLEALAINELSGGLQIIDVLAGVPVSVNAVLISQTLFGFVLTAYWRDVLVNAAFLIGFAVMLIAAVFFNLREIR